MARYRKIDSRIWNDKKFRALSDDGRMVWFLLLTHPNMTALGGMRAALDGLAGEIGWKPARFRKAFAEISEKGMALHDEEASLIVLPRFLRYNPPESPNVVKGWAGAFDLLPECLLKDKVLGFARASLEDMAEGFRKAFSEGLGKAFRKNMPNPEPEPEPEPYKRGSPETAVGVAPPEPPLDDPDAAWCWSSETIDYLRVGSTDTEASVRGMVGTWIQRFGADETADVIRQCQASTANKPLAWVNRALANRAAERKAGGAPYSPRKPSEPTGLMGAVVRMNREAEVGHG